MREAFASSLRQASRSGGEIEHVRVGAERERSCARSSSCLRVRRPDAVVRLRDVAEAQPDERIVHVSSAAHREGVVARRQQRRELVEHLLAVVAHRDPAHHAANASTSSRGLTCSCSTDVLVLFAEREALEDVLVGLLGPTFVVQLRETPPVRVRQRGLAVLWFHSSARTPPGRSTRAISPTAVSLANQWNACPANTASTDASVERDRLGRAGAHVRFRNALLEERAKLVERLDGDHARVSRRRARA